MMKLVHQSLVCIRSYITGSKTTGNVEILSNGVCGVSKERPMQLTASQVLAIEQLLGFRLTVGNNVDLLYVL